MTARAASYPSSYDLRTKGCVPPVKSQGDDYRTCWAITTMASAESGLLKKGKGSYDFSEMQLVYYLTKRPDSVFPEFKGDKLINNTGFTMLRMGGSTYFTTFLLADGVGFIKESDLPYSNAKAISTTELSPSYARDKNIATLKNADWVATTNQNEIKKIIMDKGAMAVTFSYVSYEAQYFNKENSAYYYDQKDVAQKFMHSVLIVGWDDNFSKDNFGDGQSKKPSANGAWLVQNTWNTTFGKMKGYFWISYEDASLLDEKVAVFYDAELGVDYDTLYQHDGGYSVDWDEISENRGNANSDNYMANVFTASATQDITEVSFYTWQFNVSYEIQLYTGVTGAPTSGKAALSQTVKGKLSTPGFHTIKLPSRVRVAGGKKFAVSINLHEKTGCPYMLVDANGDWGWVRFQATASKGQSYMSRNGSSWTDIGASKNQNFRIKAYGVNAASVSASQLTVSGISDQTYTGKALKPKPRVLDGKTVLKEGNQYSLSYTNNKNVGKATVKITGKGRYKGTVTKTFMIRTAQVVSLTANAVTVTKAKLKWKKQTGIAGYYIFVYDTAQKKYRQIAEVGAGKTAYTVKGLRSASVYRYRVCSYVKIDGAAHAGAYSKTCTVVTPTEKPGLSGRSSSGRVTLSWAQTAGASGYEVQMASSRSGSYKTIKTVKGAAKTSFQKSNLIKGRTYYFRIRTYRKAESKTVKSAYSAVIAVKVN